MKNSVKTAREIIERIESKQLRYRIYQASLRGIRGAIEEKAREHRTLIVYVDPRNISRLCPIYKTPITLQQALGLVCVALEKNSGIGM